MNNIHQTFILCCAASENERGGTWKKNKVSGAWAKSKISQRSPINPFYHPPKATVSTRMPPTLFSPYYEGMAEYGDRKDTNLGPEREKNIHFCLQKWTLLKGCGTEKGKGRILDLPGDTLFRLQTTTAPLQVALQLLLPLLPLLPLRRRSRCLL